MGSSHVGLLCIDLFYLMQAVELDSILALSPFFSDKFTSRLVEMINQELQSPSVSPATATDTDAFNANDVQMDSMDATDSSTSHGDNTGTILARPAWVIGTCMQVLQRRAHSEWATKVDICDWIRKGSKNWGTSPEVLAGLAPLVRLRSVFPLFFHCPNHSRTSFPWQCELSQSKHIPLRNLPSSSCRTPLTLPCPQAERPSIDGFKAHLRAGWYTGGDEKVFAG